MIPALTWFTSSVWAQASGREDRTVPFPPARRVTGICAQLPNRTLELCPVLENRGKRSRTMPILPQFNQRTPRSIVSSLVFFFFSFFGKAYYGIHGAPFLTLGFLCVGTRLRTRPKRITIMITRILLFHLYMDRGIAALEMRCPPGTGFRPRIQQPYQGNRETTSSLYADAGLDVHSLRR